MQHIMKVGYGLLVALLALLVAACGGTATAPATDADGEDASTPAAVSVSEPWVRSAVMTGMSDMDDDEASEMGDGEMGDMEGMGHGGGGNSAAYMVLSNASDTPAALVGATTDVANVIELHTTAMDESGVMRMRPVEQIDIPANGDVSLEPGGFHVMLIDLTQDLAEGDTVALTLAFADGQELAIEAPVRASP